MFNSIVFVIRMNFCVDLRIPGRWQHGENPKNTENEITLAGLKLAEALNGTFIRYEDLHE